MTESETSQVPHLQQSNQRKTEAARTTVERAVQEMKRKGVRINVNAVHVLSGISRDFIYNNEDLLALIQAEKSKPRPLKRVTAQPNERSLDSRLSTALQANADLRDENRALATRIENLTAQIFDLTTR